MISKYLSEMWAALAPALGDHLWQSTLFAVAAGLLTLVLRKNHARVRYGLWLAASIKFLIPFSFLVGIGSHMAWIPSFPGTKAGLYFALNEVSQPFTQPSLQARSAVLPSTVAPSLSHALPALLAILWICGFAAVFSIWYVRWRRISVATREAVPLHEGREVEALRRMERIGGMGRRIEMLLSATSLEPGVFGIARPVLVWPVGISEHLEDEHLEAILTHEVWHVRRRDNLAAAIHMVVEAVFWFHPLVWWLGTRLVEERERACDERVLEAGSERQVYAESILKTCEFCVGSPLTCMSGVTGADLKKRIVHIMTQPVIPELDSKKKILLGAAAVVAMAAPIVFGLVNAGPRRTVWQTENTAANVPAYEVASIKPEKSGDNMFRAIDTPDGFTATTTLQMLIRLAYGVQDFQISAAPNWVNSDKYKVEAKMDKGTVDELRKLGEDQQEPARQRMLQALLLERFNLTLHRETKELPVYSLVIAKNGPKLDGAKPGDADSDDFKGPDGRPMKGGHFIRMGMGQLTGHDLGMAEMVHVLSQQLGRTVVDNTGLKGNYNWTLKWTPDQSAPMFKGPEGREGTDNTASADSGPSIFTAIQQQLGLKLESKKGPVEILVIDHVEKPSEN
jgi:bla regulator protein BlaR1